MIVPKKSIGLIALLFLHCFAVELTRYVSGMLCTTVIQLEKTVFESSTDYLLSARSKD